MLSVCLDRHGIAVSGLGVEMVVLLVEFVVTSFSDSFSVFGLSSQSSALPFCLYFPHRRQFLVYSREHLESNS